MFSLQERMARQKDMNLATGSVWNNASSALSWASKVGGGGGGGGTNGASASSGQQSNR